MAADASAAMLRALLRDARYVYTPACPPLICHFLAITMIACRFHAAAASFTLRHHVISSRRRHDTLMPRCRRLMRMPCFDDAQPRRQHGALLREVLTGVRLVRYYTPLVECRYARAFRRAKEHAIRRYLSPLDYD